VDVDVHHPGRDLEVQHGEGVAVGAELAAVGLHDGLFRRRGLDVPPVDEGGDVLAAAAGGLGVADAPLDALEGAVGIAGRRLDGDHRFGHLPAVVGEAHRHVRAGECVLRDDVVDAAELRPVGLEVLLAGGGVVEQFAHLDGRADRTAHPHDGGDVSDLPPEVG
jgi:hypothetical protein